MGTTPSRPTDENIALVSLAGSDLIKIDYTGCQIIDSRVLEDVRKQIVALISDHDRIRLLVHAGTVSQFVFDTRTRALSSRPFVIERSAWLVDMSNVYPITRMLQSLDLEYPTEVFTEEKKAWHWLVNEPE